MKRKSPQSERNNNAKTGLLCSHDSNMGAHVCCCGGCTCTRRLIGIARESVHINRRYIEERSSEYRASVAKQKEESKQVRDAVCC